MVHNRMLSHIGNCLTLYCGDPLDRTLARRIHTYLTYNLSRDLSGLLGGGDSSISVTVSVINNGTGLVVDYYVTKPVAQYRVVIMPYADRFNRIALDFRHFPFVQCYCELCMGNEKDDLLLGTVFSLTDLSVSDYRLANLRGLSQDNESQKVYYCPSCSYQVIDNPLNKTRCVHCHRSLRRVVVTQELLNLIEALSHSRKIGSHSCPLAPGVRTTKNSVVYPAPKR